MASSSQTVSAAAAGPVKLGPAFSARNSLLQARRALDELLSGPAVVAGVDHLITTATAPLRAGGTLLCCGNGGSACDAMHFVEELTGRFRGDRPPIPALACSDVGHITCTANDYGFEEVFSRWVTALGRPGDLLIVLSTSGNSPNVVRAVEAAHAKGMKTAALLGKSGGQLAGRCTVEVVVPGATADRIQELHMLILHTVVEGIEVGLGYAPPPSA
ncbi:MAG: SIS domain-containing protein [bacterium]